MKIVFATQNQNKASEIDKLLPESIEIITLKDLGHHEELAESTPTLEGNAKQKAEFVFNKYGYPCFADDTGLEVYALNNEPGVRSARYAGDERNNDENMNLVLKKLNNNLNRSARFRTAIVFVNNSTEKLFEGVVEGKISKEKKGVKGFGYDPIFIPENSNKSFAEMSMEEKNEISHRGRAVRLLISYLQTL